MQKIQVSLDATKLRDLVSKREYTNNNGEKVEIQEVNFDLVELKEEKKKVVYETDKYALEKTHFAVARQTKEEREANKDPFFIGDGITMVWKEDNQNSSKPKPEPKQKEEEEDDLPF